MRTGKVRRNQENVLNLLHLQLPFLYLFVGVYLNSIIITIILLGFTIRCRRRTKKNKIKYMCNEESRSGVEKKIITATVDRNSRFRVVVLRPFVYTLENRKYFPLVKFVLSQMVNPLWEHDPFGATWHPISPTMISATWLQFKNFYCSFIFHLQFQFTYIRTHTHTQTQGTFSSRVSSRCSFSPSGGEPWTFRSISNSTLMYLSLKGK
jgi:hypothetical protein